jgi:hypothetical protein
MNRKRVLGDEGFENFISSLDPKRVKITGKSTAIYNYQN